MSTKADKYIAFAVLLQSLLVIIQQLLITVFQMPAEVTTIYRVVLTAIPLSFAIMISLYRRWPMFIAVYTITMAILIFNVITFPQNATFLWYDSLRFLLPTVIPSALCLTCVSNIRIVENVLYKISWAAVVCMVFYMISYFSGVFSIDSYSMSLSYGLLLPTLSLFSHKQWYSICAAIFLFVIIVALGARGAAIVFVLYVCYDTFQNKNKYRFAIIALAIIFIIFIPFFTGYLENIGIQSRTLNLVLSDDIMYDSGRGEIYNQMLNVFWDNPISGIGLWGDRAIIGRYSHNIILELYLNWGIIGATIIIIVFLYLLIRTYILSDRNNKNILVKYFLGTVIPLMVSGSYLTSYELGAFIGILILLLRDTKNMSIEKSNKMIMPKIFKL